MTTYIAIFRCRKVGSHDFGSHVVRVSFEAETTADFKDLAWKVLSDSFDRYINKFENFFGPTQVLEEQTGHTVFYARVHIP